MRLTQAAPPSAFRWNNAGVFKFVLEHCRSLEDVGRAMLWVVFNLPAESVDAGVVNSLRLVVQGRLKVVPAMHRDRGKRSRSLFPMPSPCLSYLRDEAVKQPPEVFCRSHFVTIPGEDVWVALSILELNWLAGFGRAGFKGKGTEKQRQAHAVMRKSVQQALASGVTLNRSSGEAEKELAGRFLSYSGEEVPKMQILKLKQRSIDALQLLSDGSRHFFLVTP